MRNLLASLTIAILLTSGVAYASSTSEIEGPEGCTWNATVKKSNKSSITVHVDEQYGSCVYGDCAIDAEGKTYTLTGKKYKTGEVIKIWVDQDKKGKDRATLKIPQCWTKTVMLPTAPENIAPSAGSSAIPVPASYISESDHFDMPPVQAFPPPAVTKE